METIALAGPFYRPAPAQTSPETSPGTSPQTSPEAFAALLQQNEPDLLRASRRLCWGYEDRAQDLVQDTLLRAYEAFLKGRYREEANVRAWLLCILTNLAINDHHHRRKFESPLGLDALTSSGEAGPVQTHAAPADTPGVSLLAETLDEELEQALAALSEGARRCVILVDLDGHEYAEAARILGIPVGTVRSRLSRAHGKLFQLLERYAWNQGILPQPQIKAVPDQFQLLKKAGAVPFLQSVSCETLLVKQI